jgi:flagellar hook assembly protein FlgD
MNSNVRLQIFNILGQRVTTFYDGEQAAGYQKVRWNAKVSSGIYFYHIEATAMDDPNKYFVDTKKMLFLK